MKLVRLLYKGQEHYGSLTENKISLLDGSITDGFCEQKQDVTLDEVELLCPVKPGKAVCVGLNYMDHIIESHEQIPSEPVLFIKPSTAVIGPGDSICYPLQSHRVDYEGELAIVIGKRAKNISESDAPDYILGYTCANDVTARDLQSPTGQWTRAKGFDTFLPLGPCIETQVSPDNLEIKTFLNGRVVQHSNTEKLLFKPNMVVSYISQIMTLEPEDVILTGTTLGIGPMAFGDVVEVEIEGIGRLKNIVKGNDR